MKAYFFGCWDRPGHYLVDQRGMSVRDWPGSAIPWVYELDSKLCPGGDIEGYRKRIPEIEGESLLHHKDGWTALCFWDRSVDRRGRCNSAFIAEGTHDFDGMLAIARERFPQIMARFTFEIRLAGGAK